jgi:CRP-like cAMP-binding protein
LNTDRLREVPLFAGLSRKDVEELGRTADEIDAKAGEVLARQGDIGHEFFVIEAGRATVEQDGQEINQMGPGDFFGEIALLEEERRTATVTATEDMRLIVMTGQAFRGLRRNLPDVFETVRGEIAKRRDHSA